MKYTPKEKKINSYWLSRFEKLKQFVAKHGRYPQQVNGKVERKLYAWVSAQRNRFNKRILQMEKFHLLNEWGFMWSRQSNVWLTRYKELSKYVERYGEIPSQIRTDRFPHRLDSEGKWISDKDKNLHRLSLWVMAQRKDWKLGKLHPYRLELLTDIGFDFSVVDGPRTKDFSAKIEQKIQGMEDLKMIEQKKHYFNIRDHSYTAITSEEQEVDDDYAKDEAEREKNLDHARDNMTNDLEYNEDIGEWTPKGDK